MLRFFALSALAFLIPIGAVCAVSYDYVPDRPLTRTEIEEIRATKLKQGAKTTWLHAEGSFDPTGRFQAADSLLEAVKTDDPNALPEIVDIVDEEGYTPAHRAVVNKKTAYFRHLAEKWNADLYVKNETGEPLDATAAKSGQADVVSYLLERGLDPDTRNKYGETLYDDVKDANPEIAAIIKAAGGRSAAWNEWIALYFAIALLALYIVMDKLLPREHRLSRWFDSEEKKTELGWKTVPLWARFLRWSAILSFGCVVAFTLMGCIDRFEGHTLAETLVGVSAWILIIFSASLILVRALRGRAPFRMRRAFYLTLCAAFVSYSFQYHILDIVGRMELRKQLTERGMETELIDLGASHWKTVRVKTGEVVGRSVTKSYAYRVNGRMYEIGIGDWPETGHKVRYLPENPETALYGPFPQQLSTLVLTMFGVFILGCASGIALMALIVRKRFTEYS